MTTLTLPSGQTATLRDPKTVSERLRRPVQNLSQKWAASPAGQEVMARAKRKPKPGEPPQVISDEDMAILDGMNDATVVALVESWTYEFPVSRDTLLDLPGPDYDALCVETSKLYKDLMPSFAPTSDPQSPTEPSNA